MAIISLSIQVETLAHLSHKHRHFVEMCIDPILAKALKYRTNSQSANAFLEIGKLQLRLQKNNAIIQENVEIALVKIRSISYSPDRFYLIAKSVSLLAHINNVDEAWKWTQQIKGPSSFTDIGYYQAKAYLSILSVCKKINKDNIVLTRFEKAVKQVWTSRHHDNIVMKVNQLKRHRPDLPIDMPYLNPLRANILYKNAIEAYKQDNDKASLQYAQTINDAYLRSKALIAIEQPELASKNLSNLRSHDEGLKLLLKFAPEFF